MLLSFRRRVGLRRGFRGGFLRRRIIGGVGFGYGGFGYGGLGYGGLGYGLGGGFVSGKYGLCMLTKYSSYNSIWNSWNWINAVELQTMQMIVQNSLAECIWPLMWYNIDFYFAVISNNAFIKLTYDFLISHITSSLFDHNLFDHKHSLLSILD